MYKLFDCVVLKDGRTAVIVDISSDNKNCIFEIDEDTSFGTFEDIAHIAKSV